MAGIPVGPPRSKDGKVYGLTKQQWQNLIRLLIHKRHGKNGWKTFDEMRDGAGSDHRRTIDVFAFGIWPSTRYQRVSYEIKTDRGDFMSEMRNPGKWKAWQTLSNEFWYVTLPGVVKEGEIPECCGHIEAQKSRLVIKKHAPYQDAGPIPPKLMATLMSRMAYPTPDYYESIATIAYMGRWLSKKQFDQAVGFEVSKLKHSWRAEFAKSDVVKQIGLKNAGEFPLSNGKAIPIVLAQSILSEVFGWFGDMWHDERNEPGWMKGVYSARVRDKLYNLRASRDGAISALEIAEGAIDRALDRTGRSKHNIRRALRSKGKTSLRARRRRRRR